MFYSFVCSFAMKNKNLTSSYNLKNSLERHQYIVEIGPWDNQVVPNNNMYDYYPYLSKLK